MLYIHTYVHVHTLDTHARVKCVASTYGTYAHSYYECHIITTYTYMLEGEVSLSQVPDAWCFTSQVPWHMATVLTDRYSYCGNCLLSCISLWRSDVIIYKPGSDVFQNICISMYVHIRAAGSGGGWGGHGRSTLWEPNKFLMLVYCFSSVSAVQFPKLKYTDYKTSYALRSCMCHHKPRPILTAPLLQCFRRPCICS